MAVRWHLELAAFAPPVQHQSRQGNLPPEVMVASNSAWEPSRVCFHVHSSRLWWPRKVEVGKREELHSRVDLLFHLGS